MFEKAKTGGHLYTLLDMLKKNGHVADKRAIKIFTETGAIENSVSVLKEYGLRYDQIAIAMVTEGVQRWHRDNNIFFSESFDRDIILTLKNLYLISAEIAKENQPYYWKAVECFDIEIYNEINSFS